jgi:hypothetical protein
MLKEMRILAAPLPIDQSVDIQDILGPNLGSQLTKSGGDKIQATRKS